MKISSGRKKMIIRAIVWYSLVLTFSWLVGGRDKLLELSIEYEEFQENAQEYEAELETDISKAELARQKLQLELTHTQDKLSDVTTLNIKKEKESVIRASALRAQLKQLQGVVDESRKKIIVLESSSVR